MIVMKVIADLHIHSKYARATSKNCDLEGLSHWAKIKGVGVVATGDFTHPKWLNELKANLENSENGLFEYNGAKFIISGEISVIYRIGDKVKKMHVVPLVPSFEIAEQINEALRRYGDLEEDGRPILHIQPTELMDIFRSISKEIFVILAHVWTPWFSIFGSKSGVDSIEEAFGDRSKEVGALETGLSSDPKMNWMLSSLDKYPLVSNSDAHSPQKLGREANLFELGELSYNSLINAIKTRKGFLKTYEFYPEEGKYHYDGHRNCDIILSPEESEKLKNICPKCRKKLTIGVMHRVHELADREFGFEPENNVPFKYIVPLTTVLSKVLKRGENTKTVQEEYFRIIKIFGNEFSVYEADEGKVRNSLDPKIADAITRINKGDIYWIPGYDGVFGELQFEKTIKQKRNQKSLFDF